MSHMVARAWRKNLRLMIISLKNLKEYFIDLAASLIAYPIGVIVIFYLWQIIFANANITEFTFSAIISYYIIVFLTGNIIANRYVAHKMARDVRSGHMAIYFARPFRYITYIFFTRFAQKLFFFIIVMILLVVIYLIYPLQIIADIPHVVFFVVAIFLGFILSFLTFFTLGISGFWIEHNHGIITVYNAASSILAGFWIPLEFLPGLFGQIAFALPFKYMAHFPASVLLGRIQMNEMLAGLGIEIAWIVSFLALALLLWKIGEKKFIGYGV